MPRAGERRAAMTSAIHVDNLSFRFPTAAADTVHALDWQAEEGSVTLVVGPSGSGKSTFLRCLNGLAPHFHGGYFGGDVVVAGRNTRSNGPRELADLAGMVFQDPEAQFVTDRVDDEIVFGLENLGIEPDRMRLRLEETLDLLGIAALRRRDVATLSGGERQRVALAAALATAPSVLLLDEPTSQLDPLAAQDVLGAVERLNADLGLTVVIAEHRLDRVLPFADKLLAFDPCGVRCGLTREVLANLHNVPPLIEYARRCGWTPLPLTVREARKFVISPAALAPKRPRTIGGDLLLDVAGLSFRYDQQRVLRDVALQGREGEVVALIGRNGSGKTTLLRLLMGLLRPERGQIRLGRPICDTRGRPVYDIARSAGYVPQHPSSILHQETVRAELEFTARVQGRSADIHPVLDALGVGQYRDRNPLDLSGGERQRVALAALAVTEPPLLLLDEPTRGLSAAEKRTLGDFLRGYSATGRLVVVASHDVDFVAETADRVIMLADGEIVADGAPEQVLAGSLAFATQLNRVFGGTVLTLADLP
ncbi:MAG: ABC transporter [Chloroflexi bacterium]|nr:MAG: ABC transporter [Chloroflexota bacterium]